MKGLFRALIAGYGAKKLGGGCISTILIFLVLSWLLGYVFYHGPGTAAVGPAAAVSRRPSAAT